MAKIGRDGNPWPEVFLVGGVVVAPAVALLIIHRVVSTWPVDARVALACTAMAVGMLAVTMIVRIPWRTIVLAVSGLIGMLTMVTVTRWAIPPAILGWGAATRDLWPRNLDGWHAAMFDNARLSISKRLNLDRHGIYPLVKPKDLPDGGVEIEWQSHGEHPGGLLEGIKGRIATAFGLDASTKVELLPGATHDFARTRLPGRRPNLLMNRKPIPSSLLDITARPSINDPMLAGIDASGQQQTLGFKWQSYLVVGLKRSGKSSLLHQMIGYATACRDAQAVVIDCKGGAELGAWRGHVLAFGTAAEATDLLTWAHGEMKAREAKCAELNLRAHEPSGDQPAYLIVVDEALQLRANRAAWDVMLDLITQGAAWGFSLVVSTHEVVGNVLPTELARQFDARIGFALPSPMASRIVGGEDAEARKFAPHTIDLARQRGVADTLMSGAREAVRVKFGFLDDRDLAALIDRIEALPGAVMPHVTTQVPSPAETGDKSTTSVRRLHAVGTVDVDALSPPLHVNGTRFGPEVWTAIMVMQTATVHELFRYFRTHEPHLDRRTIRNAIDRLMAAGLIGESNGHYHVMRGRVA